jgi:predicted RNase H-like HicB family nuclease
MAHYIAIVEDPGPERAVGVWFPDLPGCFSAGDTLDEAILAAPGAVALYAEALHESGRPLPRPRSLAALRADPDFSLEVKSNLVALIPIPEEIPTAA